MDVYVKNNSNNRTYYKGFPVVSENSRKTAMEWSDTKEPVEFPDELVNLCVDGIEDRMNNKIFKLYALRKIDNKMSRVYFDMYADAMLDVLQYGSVSEGVIKSPVVVIGRSKLVIKNGELHKEFLERQALKNTKAISTKDLEVGKVYGTSGPNLGLHLYLGRVKGVGHLLMDVYMPYNEKTYKLDWARMVSSPNLKFKNEDNINFTKAQIINSIMGDMARKERDVVRAQGNLDDFRNNRRQWYWKDENDFLKELDDAKKVVEKFRKAVEHVEALNIS